MPPERTRAVKSPGSLLPLEVLYIACKIKGYKTECNVESSAGMDQRYTPALTPLPFVNSNRTPAARVSTNTPLTYRPEVYHGCTTDGYGERNESVIRADGLLAHDGLVYRVAGGDASKGNLDWHSNLYHQRCSSLSEIVRTSHISILSPALESERAPCWCGMLITLSDKRGSENRIE